MRGNLCQILELGGTTIKGRRVLLINYYYYIHKSMPALVQAKHFYIGHAPKKELTINNNVRNIP